VPKNDVNECKLLGAQLTTLVQKKNIHRKQEVKKLHVFFSMQLLLCKLKDGTAATNDMVYSASHQDEQLKRCHVQLLPLRVETDLQSFLPPTGIIDADGTHQ